MSRVLHFEIHADQPERAIEFYATCFGWTFAKFNGPWDYWLVTTGPDSEPGINGGLLKRMGPIDGQSVIAYVCTLGVESLAESMRSVTEAGGTLALPRMAIPGMGWLAYMKDTEGNIFGLMEPDTAAA